MHLPGMVARGFGPHALAWHVAQGFGSIYSPSSRSGGRLRGSGGGRMPSGGGMSPIRWDGGEPAVGLVAGQPPAALMDRPAGPAEVQRLGGGATKDRREEGHRGSQLSLEPRSP